MNGVSNNFSNPHPFQKVQLVKALFVIYLSYTTSNGPVKEKKNLYVLNRIKKSRSELEKKLF